MAHRAPRRWLSLAILVFACGSLDCRYAPGTPGDGGEDGDRRSDTDDGAMLDDLDLFDDDGPSGSDSLTGDTHDEQGDPEREITEDRRSEADLGEWRDVGRDLLTEDGAGHETGPGDIDETETSGDLDVSDTRPDHDLTRDTDDAVDSDAADPDGTRDRADAPDPSDADADVTPDADAEPLRISTDALPCGVAGRDYSVHLEATGGTGAYAWAVTTELPDGIALSPAGVLRGPSLTPWDGLVGVRVQSGDQAVLADLHLSVAPELTTALSAVDPSLLYTGDSLDVLDGVRGVTAETHCAFYTEPGGGWVPGLTDLSGDNNCTLTGDPSEPTPGLYGFLVAISGACGQTTYVPVRYDEGPCTGENVVFSPGPSDYVRGRGEAHSRDLVITGVEGCSDGLACTCAACSQGNYYTAPLTAHDQMYCTDTDDVCVPCAEPGDCLVSTPASCSDSFTLAKTYTTWAHDPVGPGVGWITYEAVESYSGEIDWAELMCYPTRMWSCHFDVLEIAFD